MYYCAIHFVKKCLMFSLQQNSKILKVKTYASFFLTKHIIGLLFNEASENFLLLISKSKRRNISSFYFVYFFSLILMLGRSEHVFQFHFKILNCSTAPPLNRMQNWTNVPQCRIWNRQMRGRKRAKKVIVQTRWDEIKFKIRNKLGTVACLCNMHLLLERLRLQDHSSTRVQDQRGQHSKTLY